MNYYQVPYHQQAGTQAVTVYPTDPCVVETLQSIIGQCVVIETTRGRIEGIVQGCKPDHVILMNRNKTFFVRICEIVWIMPD
ncbi:Protein of unknown function [Paenibacillus sp. 1_12]|uniref:DUF2642 domain-containing protein n=1 Tax=Paenibacillus sp. 1_12 TaxID=1566278 RepID=UPI0008EF65DD|nr:DUF2642 domain-containing protein [Paenibacillus sp. 1_12]SFM22611.1 Protein of unknown function [Paenibacillus sp. 1_12]